MNQLELSIEKAGLNDDEKEILIAQLLNAGFEGFEEDDSLIKAFCPEKAVETDIQGILKSFPLTGSIEYKYSIRVVSEKNWNEQWEKNFSPIVIDDKILVKASFHKIPDLETTVIIEPKMSFGTGHHETTRLMLREMLQINFSDKEVLDMGCGTGVLGIVAKMKGASYVLAVDIDQWAYQNSVENYQRNQIRQPFDVFPGDRIALEGHTFHIILANINRNVLLEDMHVYYNTLKDHGTLILSGILQSDKEVVLEKAKESGFSFLSSLFENKWISLNLRK